SVCAGLPLPRHALSVGRLDALWLRLFRLRPASLRRAGPPAAPRRLSAGTVAAGSNTTTQRDTASRRSALFLRRQRSAWARNHPRRDGDETWPLYSRRQQARRRAHPAERSLLCPHLSQRMESRPPCQISANSLPEISLSHKPDVSV